MRLQLVNTLPVSTMTSPRSTPLVGISPVGTPPVGAPLLGTSLAGTPPVGTPRFSTAPGGPLPVGQLMKLLASSAPDEPQKVPMCGATNTGSLPPPAAIGSPPGLDLPMWGKECQNVPFEFNPGAWNNMLWQSAMAAAAQPSWQNCAPVSSNLHALPAFKGPSCPPLSATVPAMSYGGPSMPDVVADDAYAIGWSNIDKAADQKTIIDKKDLFGKKATKDDLHKSLEELLRIEAQRSQRCSKFMGA